MKAVKNSVKALTIVFVELVATVKRV